MSRLDARARAGERLPSVRHVCLITKDYPPSVPGGIPRAVQMQAHNLAAAGVKVHVITKSADGVERTREDAGVIVHELAEPQLAAPPGLYYLEIPLWSYVAAAKFAELDAALGFDIVEAPDYRGEALHLAPRPQTGLIVWLHSTLKVAWDCQDGYTRTPADDAWHALEMAALERADLLLAPSQLLMDTTAQFLGDRMRPAELMPYLFDSQQFPRKTPRDPDGRINVLFYGRLEARKNPELALHAVAAACARGHRVNLTVLGRNTFGYREQVLAPLQAELGLADVRYLDHANVETVRAVLGDTDVAILASRFDNSPLTIFEALSSGVPVITSERVGTASWIAPEDGLLALPIDDPDAFGSAVADAFGDAEWMASGTRAAARIRELFAPEKVTERLLDAYARLLAARGAGAPRTDAPAPPALIEGTRRSAVLAFADELIDDASLLHAWGAEFDGADDVTLVIRAPGWSAEDVQAKLGALIAQVGLQDDDACDVLAHTLPASATLNAHLATGAQAILSRKRRPAPFDSLRLIDEASIGELRGDCQDRSPARRAA